MGNSVGAIDFAEGISTGIRNTASLVKATLHGAGLQRVRFRAPRPDYDVAALSGVTHAAATTPLRPYDRQLAVATAALQAGEKLVHCARGRESSALVWTSRDRIILVNTSQPESIHMAGTSIRESSNLF